MSNLSRAASSARIGNAVANARLHRIGAWHRIGWTKHKDKVVGKSTPTNPRTTSAIDERDEEPTLGAESAGSAGFVDSALVDAQLLHAGKQCSPLDAQAGSCASWAGYKPVCLFEDAQNLLAVISLPGS